MTSQRMEALSDGVIAIIITVMVFKIEAPSEATLEALAATFPSIATFLLSFVYLGIYWNNHHHLLQATERINGLTLWANLHLLFWLSLLPFATNWMSVTLAKSIPVATYGFILLMAGCAYRLLQSALVRVHGPSSRLAEALGRDWKGLGSLIAYTFGLAISVALPLVALAVFAGVAIAWLIPDRRIENLLLLCEQNKTEK